MLSEIVSLPKKESHDSSVSIKHTQINARENRSNMQFIAALVYSTSRTQLNRTHCVGPLAQKERPKNAKQETTTNVVKTGCFFV